VLVCNIRDCFGANPNTGKQAAGRPVFAENGTAVSISLVLTPAVFGLSYDEP
jgi:hypothetical protein